MSYKPNDYNDISPYLLVGDVEAAIGFAERAFDGKRQRMIPGDDGRVIHGEVRIGDSIVMMGRAPGQPGAHVHIYMRDPDEAMARACKAGGERVQQMQEKGDGDRRGGVIDPSGTTWWLSRQIGMENK